jgi:hypothetical protein
MKELQLLWQSLMKNQQKERHNSMESTDNSKQPEMTSKLTWMRLKDLKDLLYLIQTMLNNMKVRRQMLRQELKHWELLLLKRKRNSTQFFLHKEMMNTMPRRDLNSLHTQTYKQPKNN